MKDWFFILLLIFLLVVGGVSLRHDVRKQQDIYTERPLKRVHYHTLGGDYQIDIDNDSIWLYDGGRLVGQVTWSEGKLDSLILNDNK